ncbi:33492_t:CDS:2, partial [Gigaspora margarita]
SIEANNLNKDLESLSIYAKITDGKRKTISNHINVPIKANNLNKNLELQDAYNKIIGNKRKPISKHTSIKKKRVNKESSFLANNDDAQKVILRKCIRFNISDCIQKKNNLQSYKSYTSQNTASYASLGSINGEDCSSASDSFQENLSDRDQHINDYCSTNKNFSHRSQYINDYRLLNSEDDNSDSVSLQDWLKSMALDMLNSND